MTNRLILALCVTLLFAGTPRAQEPDQEAPVAPVTPLPIVEGPIRSPLTDEASPATNADRRFWATGEYLFTWMRGSNLQPLVTTSPAGTDRTVAGVPGGNSTILFGGYQNDELHSGFRLGAGYWFNAEQSLGIEAGVMYIAGQTARFNAASNDGTILARPYIDANTGVPQAVLIAFPGSSNGSIDIRANSGNLYEAHIDLTEKALDVGWFRLNALIGYRYFRYDEYARIQQTILPTAPNFVPGTTIVSNDNFSTRNEFHGADLGYRMQFFRDEWSLELLGKVALGKINRTLIIDGNQTIVVPGADPVVRSGGVFALSSNMGTTSFGDWRAIPEIGATLGWQVTPNLSMRLGYSYLYFNSIARAGEQIQQAVNPLLFPGSRIAGGANRPQLDLQRSDFWLQSINVGVEWTY